MDTMRRDLLLAALLLAFASAARASPLNPAQIIIRLPAEHQWTPNPSYPERSVDMCPLAGSTTEPGL